LQGCREIPGIFTRGPDGSAVGVILHGLQSQICPAPYDFGTQLSRAPPLTPLRPRLAPPLVYHIPAMTDLVFFYGTLMSGFRREGRTRVDLALEAVGYGFIQAVLFDIGIYPAAIPALDSRVHGEVHRMLTPETVLQALDEFEGYSRDKPDDSLYVRSETPVSFPDGRVERAWVYFYNAPLGGAQRIESGDYLEYLKVKR
jgi:gamma-glutamylcyclotransferase (GGCT)/AIG2-like uncharacterized protein YtfP